MSIMFWTRVPHTDNKLVFFGKYKNHGGLRWAFRVI